MSLKESDLIVNFGGNVRFTPRKRYAPHDEKEVLSILNEHSRSRIRAVGSLHSWSDVIASEEVVVEMHHFDQVEVEREGSEAWVTVGAGCQLEELFNSLHREGLTLPTVPNVTPQTVAGAISTGTHASGVQSMSHFVEAVRAAAYDPESGEARIYEWTEGPELLAARCGLGCMGIILSLRFRCMPRHSVRQAVTRTKSLEEVLAAEEAFPLQTIFLLPYSWVYFAFQRRALPDLRPMTSVRGHLFRAFDLVGMDVLWHGMLELLVNVIRSPRLIRWWFEYVTPKITWRTTPHIAERDQALTREHEIYEHLEMELFVPARHLPHAIRLLQEVIGLFAGTRETVSANSKADLASLGLLETLYKHRGSYIYHQALQIRRILPDDTLISMSSSAEEPYYSISLFTHDRDKSKIYPLAHFLAHSMNGLYQARLHWGKYFPLSNEEIEPLYPYLEQFRQICNRVDPNGVFRNSYAERVLGFEGGS